MLTLLGVLMIAAGVLLVQRAVSIARQGPPPMLAIEPARPGTARNRAVIEQGQPRVSDAEVSSMIRDLPAHDRRDQP